MHSIEILERVSFDSLIASGTYGGEASAAALQKQLMLYKNKLVMKKPGSNDVQKVINDLGKMGI